MARRERKIMAALFVADSEIMTSGAPFIAVRENAAASGTKLREQMRELMAKGAVDLFRAVFVKSRIQRNEFVSKISVTGAASQSRIPLHAHDCVDSAAAQQYPRFQFKIDILARCDCRSYKDELQLLRQQRRRRFLFS